MAGVAGLLLTFKVIKMSHELNPDFSPAEITAMKYAYRQLLKDQPERFHDLTDKQALARSVIKSMEDIRPGAQRDITALVDLVMAEED